MSKSNLERMVHNVFDMFLSVEKDATNKEAYQFICLTAKDYMRLKNRPVSFENMEDTTIHVKSAPLNTKSRSRTASKKKTANV